MARFDDGEIYMEFDGATQESVQRGLVAARQHFAVCGVNPTQAMKALAKREKVFEQEMAWEAGQGSEPEAMSDHQCELADIAEEAMLAAQNATGADAATLGYPDLPVREKEPPVLRDLFEPA